MDEKLEKVVEFVGEGVDGTRLGLRSVVFEGQRLVGLDTRGERYIL